MSRHVSKTGLGVWNRSIGNGVEIRDPYIMAIAKPEEWILITRKGFSERLNDRDHEEMPKPPYADL